MVRGALTTYPPTRTGFLQTRTHLDVDLVVGTLLGQCHVFTSLWLIVHKQLIVPLQHAVLFNRKLLGSQLRCPLTGQEHTAEYCSHARDVGWASVFLFAARGIISTSPPTAI